PGSVSVINTDNNKVIDKVPVNSTIFPNAFVVGNDNNLYILSGDYLYVVDPTDKNESTNIESQTPISSLIPANVSTKYEPNYVTINKDELILIASPTENPGISIKSFNEDNKDSPNWDFASSVALNTSTPTI